MAKVTNTIERVASADVSVMLLGASGTGKELLARAVHENSPRAGKPYVKVHCAALSANLLESELFGHVKGAFTSAHENRTGRFEAAHGGTIFLDEINSISYTLRNNGTAPLNWTATKIAPWLDLSATGGTLAPNATATVTLALNSAATTLAAGITAWPRSW